MKVKNQMKTLTYDKINQRVDSLTVKTRINVQSYMLEIVKGWSFVFILLLSQCVWGQTPFDFSKVRVSRSNLHAHPIQHLAGKVPLIPLQREYQGEETKGIYYFNKSEQKSAQILIKDGLFYRISSPEKVVNPDIPVPLLLPSIESPPLPKDAKKSGYAIFVMDRNQHLYISFLAQQGKVHHSSLLAGDSVLCAGEMQIFQGTLKYLNNRSGHYQPPPKTLRYLIEILKSRGVKFEAVKVEYFGVDLN